MSRKKVSFRVMKKVIKDLGGIFATKDVSEDQRMIKAHPKLVKHSHYHAFVGGALSDHRVRLRIKEIQKRTSRGSRWQKLGFSNNVPSKSSQTIDREIRSPSKAKADKPFTLVCPSCGGRLKRTETPDRFICAHCGNEHIINL